jgi:prepilin-type N-terminal cleavage/methylation domain-containing protein
MRARSATLPASLRRGFSLVEVLVAAAVVVLLVGLAVPMMRTYLRDGCEEEALVEAKAIAQALQAFHDDLGVWPSRSSAGVDTMVWVLGSGASVPTESPFLGSNPLADWLVDGVHGDTLDRHLRQNAPGGKPEGSYPIQGERRWQGPYGAGPFPLDPWGRPYLVVVRSGTSTHATRYKRLFVLSAGPDGVLDTPSDMTRTTEIHPADIGVVVSDRR